MSTSVSEKHIASILSVEVSCLWKVAGYREVVGGGNGSRRRGMASQNQQETYAVIRVNYSSKVGRKYNKRVILIGSRVH
jgi:hypothetical protein